ncbi:MAG: proton-conducting transporter membrane subunit [Roseiflexus sp.]
MVSLALMLPLIGAIVCLALDRFVASQLIGLGAAGILLLSAVLIVVARLQGLPLIVFDQIWLQWDNASFRNTLVIDPLGWLLAVVASVGGAFALLGAALAIAPDLRGFGRLFAALIVIPGMAIPGACSQTLPLMAFAPAVIGVAWFVVLRSGGVLLGSNAPLVLVLSGGAAALFLLAVLLSSSVGATPGSPVMIVAGILIAVWTLCGLPPLFGVPGAAHQAPATLAVVAPFGLPLIGITALLRLLPDYLTLLEATHLIGVVAIGTLAFVLAAARALWTQSLRQMAAAQFSAQVALIVVCAGSGKDVFLQVAPALAINALLSTLGLMLSIATLERRSGVDDVTVLTRHPDSTLYISTIGLFVAASSAAGIPGAWGFWTRLWLFDAIRNSVSWALAPLLVGSSLLALAMLAPLVRFWHASGESPSLRRVYPGDILPVVVGAVLAFMGAAPRVIWNVVLSAIPGQFAPATGMLRFPSPAGSIAISIAALLLIIAPVVLRRVRQRRLRPAEERLTAVLTPDTIGTALYGPAWLAAPTIPEMMHAGLAWITLLIRQRLAVLGRRYYLAAIVFALIVVILVFAAE